MNRRDFVPLIAAGALSGYAGFVGGRREVPQRHARSTVAMEGAASYNGDLLAVVRRGLENTGLEVAGQRVLLKPQLAAWSAESAANVHPAMLHAVFSVLREKGAAQVLIGDAPVYHRDTYALAVAAGYRDAIADFDEVFADLHGDDVVAVQGFNGSELFLPAEAMRADVVVSLAKLKTDARHGVALSITNLFGLIPGSVYGLPVGEDHKLTTPRAATELARFFRRSYAIIDGVVGMEGGGPAEGKAKPAGAVLMGSDLVAVDATSCRLMGINPKDIEYLALAADRQGVLAENRIELVGDAKATPIRFQPGA